MPSDFDVLVGTARTTATHYPSTATVTAGSSGLLVLGHGAGAGHRHPFMTAVAERLASSGVDVVTFNFLYVEQGRKAPDRTPVLEECFRAVVDAAVHQAPRRRLFIGGKSMGGRMATHLAAAGVPDLTGVLALGYPLHPPGQPHRPRTAHLPQIAAPMLVVQGERDAFGTPEELRPVIDTIPGRVRLHVVPGGDHSFVVRGMSGDAVRTSVCDLVVSWIAETIAADPRPSP